MKAEYSIGEISELFELSKDTLRFYERKGLLSPVRGENNYRIYRSIDLWKLNIIKRLRGLNFSIKDIKYFLDHRTRSTELSYLKKEKEIIEKELNRLKKQHLSICDSLNELENIIEFNQYDKVIYNQFEERKILFLDQAVETDSQIDFSRNQLIIDYEDMRISDYNFGAILDLKEINKKQYTNYRGTFLLTENTQDFNTILEEGLYATIRFQGPYSKSAKAYNHLLEDIKSKGLQPGKFAIEKYIIDIHQTSLEEEYITEIQMLVLT